MWSMTLQKNSLQYVPPGFEDTKNLAFDTNFFLVVSATWIVWQRAPSRGIQYFLYFFAFHGPKTHSFGIISQHRERPCRVRHFLWAPLLDQPSWSFFNFLKELGWLDSQRGTGPRGTRNFLWLSLLYHPSGVLVYLIKELGWSRIVRRVWMIFAKRQFYENERFVYTKRSCSRVMVSRNQSNPHHELT